MENKTINYLFLILFHAALGGIVFLAPVVSKVYAIAIFLVSLYFIIKTRNRNNEVLYAAAYVVGSEVFLRMTGGNPNHEFSKYSLMIFVTFGMFYSGFSKNAIPFWIFLLLLVPGIIIGTQTLSLEAENIRKSILFNVSGPISLAFAALYCYNRKISIKELNNILLLMGLPIISCTIYLILFTPSNFTENLNSTGSNFEASGGFGPNQVATCLGLGFFIFFTRVVVASEKKIFLFINLALTLLIGYRGLITFSRGGMITGIVMIVLFLVVVYAYTKKVSKLKLFYIFSFLIVCTALTWLYTENQTGGLLGKRYANQDAYGRVKPTQFSGREQLAKGEIEMFLNNPFFGVGAAKGTELRSADVGFLTASHDEITRMLAEHGSLGILGLLILFATPIFLYLDNKQHLYVFCFLAFWLLTINHADMRTASPSFVYALSLLKVKFDEEEDTVHRK